MAYFQQNPPPPNKIYSFSLKEFVGGLNNRSNVLEPNQASALLNMTFADDSVMEKRRGTTFFDSQLSPGEVVYIDEFRPYNDDDVIVRATKDALYFGSIKVCDLAGKMTGINFRGKYFFCDGEAYRVYGYFPQEGNTYEELKGTPIDAYTLLEVTNPPIGYTPLDTTHTRGKTVYDYALGQVWYEPCANEMADTFKNGNVLPPSPRFLISHKGRIFASGSDNDNDNVFITDVQNPYYFPSSLPMQLPPNSDRVAGMAIFDDALVVGRRMDIYAITGNTNRTDTGSEVFELKKVTTHTGFASHEAIDVANNYLFFLGADGNTYSMSNAQGVSDKLVTQIINKTVDFYRDPVNIDKTNIYTAASTFFDDKWYLTMGDKVMVFSYRNQAWTMYDGLNARCFYQFQNVLLWGDKNGMISMPSEDYLDYGVPFKAYWTSRGFDMEDSNSYKHFREFFLVAHTFKDFHSDIRLTFEIDFSATNAQALIANQVSVWGKARWGDRFVSRNVNSSFPFYLNRRGREVRFTFTNGYKPQADSVATPEDLIPLTRQGEGTCIFVRSDNTYYALHDTNWQKLEKEDYNQPMRVYQMNGDYEFRQKR